MRHFLADGPNVCIDAVGMHVPKSFGSRMKMTLGMTPATPADVLHEMIEVIRQASSSMSGGGGVESESESRVGVEDEVEVHP